MTLQLKAQKREALGTKAIKQIREQGLIPAELYGKGVDNIHLSVDKKEFEIVYKEGGESTIVNIDIDGTVHPVLIHDVQIDPVLNQAAAIDFYEVNLKEKITTNVPLEFTGEAPAVENMGGVLIKVIDEVEIEALPMSIPQNIEVDISSLDDFQKSIHVSDLKSTDDFEILTDKETVVANVAEPREEEEEPVEEVSVDDVEVEGEKQDEEGGSEEEKPSGEDNPQEQEKPQEGN